MAYSKLSRWIKDFHLVNGFVVKTSNEMECSKKLAIKFIEIPTVKLRDESYFELMNLITKLEEILISNDIFPNKNIRNFPFIKNDEFRDKEYIHLIKPSDEFNYAIGKALKSMKPFNALRNVFNEYGHLFPLKIILGKSLKNILSTNCF
ncbi:12957_t:CDS:2, partial [Funneliformis geosporum]